MEVKVAKLEEKMCHIEEKVDKLGDKIDKLNDKLTQHLLEPAESWNKLKWLIISTLIVAIIGLILTLVGLKP